MANQPPDQAAAATGAPLHRAALWTTPFLLLCSSQFLAYAQWGLLTPTLPLYLSALGATETTIGFTLAAFSVASIATRPTVGYWSDTRSAVGALWLGSLCVGLTATAYLVPLVWTVVIANVVMGIGWGAINVSGNALLAETTSPNRRAEAANYYSVFQSSVSMVSPSIALWLLSADQHEFAPVFLLAGACGLGAAFLSRGLPERRDRWGPASAGAGEQQPPRITWSDLFERSVWLPTLLVVCSSVPGPAVTAMIPLYAEYRGISIEGVTYYFLARAVASLLGRVVLGAVLDRFGRGPSLAFSFVLAFVGLALLLSADNLGVLVAGAIVFSLGDAIAYPVTFALAIDQSDPRRRGAAMATYTSAFQIGMALGSMLVALLVERAGYEAMYVGSLAGIAFGLAVVGLKWRTVATARSY